jgi:Protein of unknown function (DUF1573)
MSTTPASAMDRKYFGRFAKNLPMRPGFGCMLVAVLFMACTGQDKKAGAQDPSGAATKVDSANVTTIQWLDSANRDFGKIAEGQVLQIAFRFRNAGSKPLIIKRVQPSCGCTIAEQPDKPVMPGEDGVIKAAFDSEHHVGINHKTLYVYANTPHSEVNELQFRVEVEKKKW